MARQRVFSDKLVSDRQIREDIVPVSHMTIYRWRKQNKFPQPDLRINGQNYTWLSHVLAALGRDEAAA